MASLLIGKAGIRLQVIQGQAFLLRQRIVPADEHMRLRGKQRRKGEIVVPQGLPDHCFIEPVQVQHPDLAAQVRHVFNDLIGLAPSPSTSIRKTPNQLSAAYSSKLLKPC